MYLHLGMKLKKVHRVIEFSQGDYMNKWVSYCTCMRSNAKTEFEKQFWKLMVNAVSILVFSYDLIAVTHNLKMRFQSNCYILGLWKDD